MKRGKPKHRRHRARPESAQFAGEIMTLYGVADYLNCHPSTVSRLLISGKLRGFHLGGACAATGEFSVRTWSGGSSSIRRRWRNSNSIPRQGRRRVSPSDMTAAGKSDG